MLGDAEDLRRLRRGDPVVLGIGSGVGCRSPRSWCCSCCGAARGEVLDLSAVQGPALGASAAECGEVAAANELRDCGHVNAEYLGGLGLGQKL